MVGLYKLDVDLISSKLQTASSVLVSVICVCDIVMKQPLTYFIVHIAELLRRLLMFVLHS